MSLPTYEEIGFGWRGHRAALRFLAAIYRAAEFPQQLREHYGKARNWRGVLKGGLALWLHVLPSAFVICLLGRYFMHGVLGLPARSAETEVAQHLLSVCKHLAGGLAGGLAYAVGFLRLYSQPAASGQAPARARHGRIRGD